MRILQGNSKITHDADRLCTVLVKNAGRGSLLESPLFSYYES
jgi:hypothetical protein